MSNKPLITFNNPTSGAYNSISRYYFVLSLASLREPMSAAPIQQAITKLVMQPGQLRWEPQSIMPPIMLLLANLLSMPAPASNLNTLNTGPLHNQYTKPPLLNSGKPSMWMNRPGPLSKFTGRNLWELRKCKGLRTIPQLLPKSTRAVKRRFAVKDALLLQL